MKRMTLARTAVVMVGMLVVLFDDARIGGRAQAADAIQTGAATAQTSGRSSPRFAADGPSADEYGARQGYPVLAILRPRFMVGLFSHFDSLWEARPVARAAQPSLLARADTEPAIAYEYHGRKLDLDDYLARNPATGLLIARGDTILVERYQYGRTDKHRLASFSMAKTVTSMLIGIAIEEGAIRSIDDPAAVYAPSLQGTEFGATSIRHLLQMTSGVRFNEDRDVDALWAATVGQAGPGGGESVKAFNDRHRRAGAVHNYSSADSQVLALVLAGALKRPLAQYLQERIWQPMGAEADASWMIDASGQETGWTGLNAVLRDYARFGLLLAHGGRSGQRQIIPAHWIRSATQVSADDPHLHRVWPDTGMGYGYQVRVFDDRRPMFALLGACGQAIYVDPRSRLVMVHTAVRQQISDPNLETLALWRAVVATLGVCTAVAHLPLLVP
jgi:CubicO group peptidase (beta-lactamase class C family)